MKNKSKTSTARNTVALPADAGTKSEELSSLFPVEFIEFTRQLKAIRDWFEYYGNRRKDLSDITEKYLNNISDYTGEIAYNIGELAAIEFNQALFYAEK
jgi:hypothetical protein